MSKIIRISNISKMIRFISIFSLAHLIHASDGHSELKKENKESLPNLAVEFTFSPKAFGGTKLIPNQQSSSIFALDLLFQYQPKIIQKYGVLGIGPFFTVYPMSGSGDTSTAFSNLSFGGQIHYQARYFERQPVVPVVSYSVEYFNYRFLSGVSGSLIASGPTAGLWLFLNFLEPSSSNELFLDYGILRSYLVAEYRMIQGSNKDLTFSGGSLYFGLRFEF